MLPMHLARWVLLDHAFATMFQLARYDLVATRLADNPLRNHRLELPPTQRVQ